VRDALEGKARRALSSWLGVVSTGPAARRGGTRLALVTANGQPPVAAHSPDSETALRRHTLQVPHGFGGKIAPTVVFQDPSHCPRDLDRGKLPANGPMTA